MKRFARVRLDEAFLGLEMKEKWVERARETPPASRQDLVLGRAYDLPDCAHLAALSFYLAEEHEKARAYATECVQTAVSFFWGKWRADIPTPPGMIPQDWLHTHHRWMGVYEGSLLWSSVLGDQAAKARIAEYPTERCKIDLDCTAQDRTLYLALGAVLSPSRQEYISARLQALSECSHKSKNLLCTCLQHLVAGDGPSLERSLAIYLKHYRKSEFPKPLITSKISAFATILFHEARHRGIDIAVPDEYVDHIVAF